MRHLLGLTILLGAGTAFAGPADDLAKACDKGKGKACVDLADLVAGGKGGVIRDPAKAAKLYEAGCTLKVAAGCTNAYLLYVEGNGDVGQNLEKALDLGDKACTLGDGRVCNNMGVAWSEAKDGVDSADHVKARLYYEKACKQSHGLGCFNLGNVYRLGEGVNVDLAKAATQFQRSCDLSEPRGCTELGIMYYEGKPMKKDVARAKKLLERACNLHSEPACKNLELLRDAKQ